MATSASNFLTRPPTGRAGVLGGLPTYFAKPATVKPRAAVLFLSDIYGWEAPANRAFADLLADEGFLTVIPDFFKGDKAPVNERSKIPEWRARHPAAEVSEDIKLVISELKGQGVEKIGAIGFCWGGLHSARLAATDLVEGAVVNHGSALSSEVIEAIKLPVQFNCAENDNLLPLADAEKYRSILESRPITSDFKIFAGQVHGWTVRPDRNSPEALSAAAEAFDRVKAFFTKLLL